jgi:hypothetical protein
MLIRLHRHDWEPARIIEQQRTYPHATWAKCVKCGKEKG